MFHCIASVDDKHNALVYRITLRFILPILQFGLHFQSVEYSAMNAFETAVTHYKNMIARLCYVAYALNDLLYISEAVRRRIAVRYRID
jgi:hypothetical protein